MIRFVVAPDGTVTPDVRRKLPGRGAWLLAQKSLVAQAASRRAFNRAFKAEVSVPQSLADDVAALLRAGALQRLALAQKAGLVVAGFEKVSAALRAGRVAGLVLARDGADDGRRKLQALANQGDRIHNVWIEGGVFSSVELERTLGRHRVVHVALSPGRLSDLFLLDARRLRGYEFGPSNDAGHPHTPDERLFAGPKTL